MAELDDTNMQIEDTNPTNNTTTEKTKTIPISVLIQLYNAGFRKLVSLLADSKIPNVHDHLITEEEIKMFGLAEGKPVRIIHQKPNFWTALTMFWKLVENILLVLEVWVLHMNKDTTGTTMITISHPQGSRDMIRNNVAK